MSRTPLIWVEVSASALRHNLAEFRRLAAGGQAIYPVVKSNAYGHGLEVVAPVLAAAGAGGFAVNSLEEGAALRRLGIAVPILVLGHVALADLEEAAELDLDLTVYNRETLAPLARVAAARGRRARVHVKLETGTHRQGVLPADLADFARTVRSLAGLALHGLSTHFANIEDTTDHSYARRQLDVLNAARAELRAAGMGPAQVHCACSAAALLFPETHFDMLRVGIGVYGLWPSRETLVSAGALSGHKLAELRPALAWKTRVVQVKSVPAGVTVGYGCTYKTSRPTHLAILPVGYFDGYDRGLWNQAYVLIAGRRAPVRGRICMNLTMVDVTDIPAVGLEQEVVLLGEQDGDAVSAETMAQWIGTINYEVVTRIGGHLARILVG